MITETLLNSLKSLFSSLGAKTSDSNYAVGLFDKTNGEPKGMMGMSDLASVLGGAEQHYIGNATRDFDTFGDGVFFLNLWQQGWTNQPGISAWAVLLSYTSNTTMKFQVVFGNHGELSFRIFSKDTSNWSSWFEYRIPTT